MSALEKCVHALREIRDEGVTSLRAVYLIDDAITAAEAAPSEADIRGHERARVEGEVSDFLTVEANAWRDVVGADCQGEKALRQAQRKIAAGAHRGTR